MKETEYKDFSLNTHRKNWRTKKPNVCQFELTFKCGLRCRHCYTDCYNSTAEFSKELKTDEIKIILDKVYDSGAIWLCFTGGDPLTRPDFLEIYSYAKRKGFIVTIFTNCYSMTQEIADFLVKEPPFVIEFTLNGVTKETYERVSQVKGSYEKTMAGLKMLLDRGLPIKIKTQLTKDNFNEREEIKRFIEKLGLTFRPTILIYPRLNSDITPCVLRLSPEEILILNGRFEKDCDSEPNENNEQNPEPLTSFGYGASEHVFRCAVGSGDGFHIDPCGNMFLCNLIRKPGVNLLRSSIEEGQRKITPFFKGRKFSTDSKCRACSIRNICYNCPGNAYLETGDAEFPVEYHCRLAGKLSHCEKRKVD